MAEVNENGEVTVEGEFVGKLEGFRFQQDKETNAQEAKTIKSASLQALLPHFNLRADRLYNAPDTEIDFTDQGGLMWGDQAVGKLIAGDHIMHPKVSPFVDSEAGTEVLSKVERRLQHFIDRKVSVLFEPLMELQKDEELTGLAKGFGFQLFESLGILRRQNVLAEVKSLDQDARALLRKHGVRFGQFTVFMPLLLKPAPTRLRLVLWALSKNLDEFPEAPPPGLVTVPVNTEAPEQYDDMSGYRNAGDRAIRIDMLERLADFLRVEDSRNGFEANADMLSITGMTLEQFANLMEGLGYSAEKAEREKVKVTEISESVDIKDKEKSSVDALNNNGNALSDLIEDQGELVGEKDIETFYTFKWINKQIKNKRSNRDKQTKPRDGETGRSKYKRKANKEQRVKSDQQKSFGASPEKSKTIDPDNPFAAALMDFSKKIEGIKNQRMTEKIRLDTWLWYARFYKSRSLSSKAILSGKLRLNSNKIIKPASKVKINDVLTINHINMVRIIQVQSLGSRRGPASEAQTLYYDLSEDIKDVSNIKHVSEKSKKETNKRPTKKDRRILDKIVTKTLE